MSALHRLKAYFGMVPADEFDPAHFDEDIRFQDGRFEDARFAEARFAETQFGAAQFEAADFDGYHPGARTYAPERAVPRRPPRSGYADPDYRDDGGLREGSGFRDDSPAPAGRYATSRVHPTRSPSMSPSMDARGRSSRGSEPWSPEPRVTASRSAEAPVRGSLAIDTAAEAALIENRTTTRQPIPAPAFGHESRADLLDGDEAGPEGHPLSRIVTLHPHSYNEARPIGERYREGNPVIMNLTAMEDRDAKRLVDFAAGLAFALRGSIDKVTNKVFLLSPPDVDVSAEDRRRIAEERLFT